MNITCRMLNNNLITQNLQLKQQIHEMEANLADKDNEIANLKRSQYDRNVVVFTRNNIPEREY